MSGLRGSFKSSLASTAPAMPGACMVPAPGGGAGMAKRGRRNVAIGTSKKRKKAVIPRFGGQTDMLEAEIRVRRLLEIGQLAESADLFLKSGGDADPCVGHLVQALLQAGNLSMAARVARASKQSALLSQTDVVRCLAVMPQSVQQEDGHQILEALICAASWPSREHEHHFRQVAGSIVSIFLQERETLQDESDRDRSDFIEKLQAIHGEDAVPATTELVINPVAMHPLPAQAALQREPHADSRDEETSSDIDTDYNVLENPRIAKSNVEAVKRQTGHILVGAHVSDAENALHKQKKDSPSPFLSGVVNDVSSLGLIARAPLSAPKQKRTSKAAGMLGLSGYGSSSGSEEAEAEGEEDSSES